MQPITTSEASEITNIPENTVRPVWHQISWNWLVAFWVNPIQHRTIQALSLPWVISKTSHSIISISTVLYILNPASSMFHRHSTKHLCIWMVARSIDTLQRHWRHTQLKYLWECNGIAPRCWRGANGGSQGAGKLFGWVCSLHAHSTLE